VVSCTTVRDLLSEHALGVAGSRESAIVERHLAWCAACRKESRDLTRAASTLAFALAPASPSPALEERVVNEVRDLAGRRIPADARPRRPRRAGTLVLAAAIALSGLGVGAVIATRATPQEQAAATNERTKDALAEFRALIEGSALVDPETDAFLGILGPEGSSRGGGTALTIVVPAARDQAVVMVNGLPDRVAMFPYQVELSNGKGEVLDVGSIPEVDSGGEATLARVVARDLSGYVNVIVTDSRDRVILRGTLRERATVPSPAP
jgi:hypothetical protein